MRVKRAFSLGWTPALTFKLTQLTHVTSEPLLTGHDICPIFSAGKGQPLDAINATFACIYARRSKLESVMM